MSDIVTEVSNTPTAVAPIEVNSGDGPISFDELDAIEASSRASKRAEKNETKEVVKETVKALEKKNDKTDSASKEKSEKEEGKETDSKKTGTEKDKGKLGGDKAASKEAPKLKLKSGDKEIELSADTMVPVVRNGVEEFIPLKDLRNDYSGRKEWNTRFSEMDRERKDFKTKVDQANSKIKSIFETQDPEMRFYHMAEFAGQDPVAVRQKFLNENMKLLEKWYTMSDDERVADAKDFENKVLKHRLESRDNEDSERQAQVALTDTISKLGKTHQFEQQDFWQTFDRLKAAKEQNKLLDPQGKPLKLTPETVAEFISKDRLYKAALPIIKDSTAIQDHAKQAALFDLVADGFKMGMNANEIKQVAMEMWTSKVIDDQIAAKVEEQEELRTGKKGTKKANYKADNEAMFFGDIM